MSAWHEVKQWVVMIDKSHPCFWHKGVITEIIDKHAIVDFRIAGCHGVDCRFDQLETYMGLKHDAPAQPATGGGADAVTSIRTAGYEARIIALQKKIDENAQMALNLAQEVGQIEAERDTLRTQLADANARAAAAEAALETIEELYPYSTTYEAMDKYRDEVQDVARKALAYKARPTAGE